MSKVSKPQAFLLYWFRIRPDKAAAFQAWARERGMHFWQQHEGIIRYRTFRQQSGLQLQEQLAGAPAEIHGISMVEAEDVEVIQRVLSTAECRLIQGEFCEFIEPESLKHSMLDCAYDSWITPVEVVQESMTENLPPAPMGVLHH